MKACAFEAMVWWFYTERNIPPMRNLFKKRENSRKRQSHNGEVRLKDFKIREQKGV